MKEKRTDQRTEELQDPDNWDYGSVERHPGIKKPRAVISVAFKNKDYEQVAQFAARLGVTTSALIRDSVLQRVSGKPIVPSSPSLDASSAYSTYAKQVIPTNVQWTGNVGFTIEPTTSIVAEGTRAFHVHK